MPDVKLLIAEDEDNIRNSIEKYIRNHTTYISEIYTASDGQSAIDLIFRHHPQIMLLDIQMPLKDGLTVMKEASTAGACPKTIIMSGHDEFHYAQQALRYGAVEYLLKPCRSTEILERIGALVYKEFSAPNESVPLIREDGLTGNSVVDAALAYMREHYHEDLTLTYIAEKVGRSPSYLSTLFTRTLGCGFADYLNCIRIERACDYFYDSQMKTYEIAFKVGFNDEKYFSNVFKRIKGKSPSEYRKTMTEMT